MINYCWNLTELQVTLLISIVLVCAIGLVVGILRERWK